MNELLPPPTRSNEDNERLYQKLVALWKRMHFYPKYDMDGELIGGETIIADEVENLADQSKNELLPKI